jgi:cyclic pyranopterin phosphate synthase
VITEPIPLVDSFGRTHRDLRISVTDRCNFRCTYCMPAEGLQWLDRADVLTFEEIERVARVCVERFGFDAIRLTGGEPTVRAHLPVLVAKLAALAARQPDGSKRSVDLSMTTNGATLALVADDLAEAGLRRVNISLDSLRHDRFAALTRRDALDRVLEGIDAALAAGLTPVKLNAVIVRGENDDEIVELARFGRDRGVVLRFIEYMPLDAEDHWQSDQVVPSAEIVGSIDEHWPLEAEAPGHEPARRWRYRDGAGEIGVIPSVTDAFCSSCDRVRLTADGALRACLFAVEETDLRGPMRAGATDDDLAALLASTVAGKRAGHGIGEVHFLRPRRSMSQIGG